jgi:hypothetical protein
VSQIFNWFRDDFVSGAIGPFIARYVDDGDVAEKLRRVAFVAWIKTLTLIKTLSLAIDHADVARYVLGDRT